VTSGDGTRAFAIMGAYHKGFMPNVSISALISTEENSVSLTEAKICGIKTIVVDVKKTTSEQEINQKLQAAIKTVGCDLVFLTDVSFGIYPIDRITMYKIYPADPLKFSGPGIYGVKVCQKVLEEIMDGLVQGNINDRYFIHPTVHEVVSASNPETILMSAAVQIPLGLFNNNAEFLAKILYKHIERYEWLMLSAAVNMAAHKFIHSY